MSYRRAAFTFDSEFEWPEGYRRVDSAGLTRFQYWVSYMPLWDPDRPVGSFSKGILYQPGEIARPFTLPWRTTRFCHYAIPLQLLVEFDIATRSWWDFFAIPDKGDTLTFKKWIEGRVVYNARDSLYFLPDEPKEVTKKAFNGFFSLVVQNTNYLSLTYNCDTVPETHLLPGDLLIAHDDRGRSGVVYIIMCVVLNDSGNRLYLVGTGCEDACDFHIPLFNDRKDYPWIDLETMKSLVPEAFAHKGFYRLKGQ
jgi:hypothetical protein